MACRVQWMEGRLGEKKKKRKSGESKNRERRLPRVLHGRCSAENDRGEDARCARTETVTGRRTRKEVWGVKEKRRRRMDVGRGRGNGGKRHRGEYTRRVGNEQEKVERKRRAEKEFTTVGEGEEEEEEAEEKQRGTWNAVWDEEGKREENGHGGKEIEG